MAGGSSTGYRGVSRGFRPFIRPDPKPTPRTQPPLVFLTRPVRCDQCRTLVPAGSRGRYYGYRTGAKFYGETCHATPKTGTIPVGRE